MNVENNSLIRRINIFPALLIVVAILAFLLPATIARSEKAFAASGNYAPDEFVTTWKTDLPGFSADNQVYISTFTIGGAPYVYNFNVDWGDGTTSTGLTSGTLHTYPAPGTYEVKITGKFPTFVAGNDSTKLLSVEHWGNNKWETTSQSFYGATRVQFNADDKPDLSDVTSMSMMFYGAFAFNSDISDWDVSNVASMTDMFAGAFAFNQPLNDWDVSNVQYFSNMFYGASSFDQPLNNWDVSSALRMTRMFAGASSFDQSLGSWDVSNISDMEAMFIIGSNQTLFPNIGSVPLNPSGLSTENYDDTLIGWSSLNLKNNVRFDAGLSTYCDAEDERQSIIDTFNWTINDSGPNCVPVEETTTTTTTTTTTVQSTVPETTIVDPTTTIAPDVTVGGISVTAKTLPLTGSRQLMALVGFALMFISVGIMCFSVARNNRGMLN